jgi:cell division protease FtsH
MVTKWGLSSKLGPLTYSEENGEVFLGRQVTQHKQVSDETAHVIDVEIRSVIEANYKRAKEILETNIDKLHAMAEALVKYETIDEQQIKDIMQGKAPKPPADWDDSVGTPPPKRPESGESEGGPIGSPAGQH